MMHHRPIYPFGRTFRAVNILVLFPLVVLFFSCEREIILSDPALKINGYGIEGHVFDRFGNPIPGVEVYLDYGTRFVDNGPEPPREYVVTGNPENINVRVYNRSGGLYKTIGTFIDITGPFEYDWDKLNQSNQPALPGIYSVRYFVGADQRLSYPVLVFNTRITLTDSSGRYAVADQFLPVDFYPIPEYSFNGTYFGNSQITSEVFLLFSSSQGSIVRSLITIKDQLVQFDVRIN